MITFNGVAGRPWIEDVTAVPGTHCLERTMPGVIRAVDLSPDGKTMALVIKDEEYNVRLHLVSVSTGEDKITPLDIKSLNDRVGIAAKFLGVDNLVFVGSITTFITHTGNQVKSGIDMGQIDLKEKFSIECCDSSARYLACGLTTFPWGGKSLHLAVLDLKNKKCAKTLEVLRFRFGGSAQCSIKATAVGRTQPYVCACVKQTPKAMERVIVWNVTKWQVTNSIDVHSDDITKAVFVGEGDLLMGSSIRSSDKPGSFTPVSSQHWRYKDVTNKTSVLWNKKEANSMFSTQGSTTLCCRWQKENPNAVLELWSSSPFEKSSKSTMVQYRIQGLQGVGEIFCDGQNNVICVSHEGFSVYSLQDLEIIDARGKSSSAPNIYEINVHSLVFLPKSDTAVLTISHASEDESVDPSSSPTYSVYLADLSCEEVHLTPTPFREVQCGPNKSSQDRSGQFSTFQGSGTSSEMCIPSPDSNFLVLNTGSKIMIWDRKVDSVKSLPTFDELSDKSNCDESKSGLKCFVSPKENIGIVVYGQQAYRGYIYDLRTGNELRKFQHKHNVDKASITDLVFLPSNGQIFTYHRAMDSTLSAWNIRSCECISSTSLPISFARVSPASDRIALSIRTAKHEGQIVLRNSEGKFSRQLATKNPWLPSSKESDFEFSADGTILLGVSSSQRIFRVWNAGNGELLTDLHMFHSGHTQVMGMLTNSHALFHDTRFITIDVAKDELTTVLPLDVTLDSKWSPRGLRLSPRGQVLAGASHAGRLAVFHCHNFATAKRMTTLQRVKSLAK